MSITVKARAIKEVFHRDNFYIISFAPTESNRDIQLNQWGNFSCCGDIGYITVDKEYELILEEGKVSKYGMSYVIKDVPSLKMENIADLSLAEKKDILMQCTSSERLADNILSVYPNYIERVLTEGEESIDTKPLKGIGKAYHHAYCRILNEKFKYFHFIHNEHIKPYEITITEAKKLFDVWSRADEIIKQIESNPYYVLIEICGRSFERVDNLLKTVRADLVDSDVRCEAVVMDILKRNEEDSNSRLNGNVCYTVMRDEYNCGHFKDRIVKVCEESDKIYYDKESKDLSLFTTYMKECNIASFARTANNDCVELDFDVEKYRTLDNGITLSDEQLQAVENFKKYNLSILQGSAGCGKSTSAQAIVNVCKDLGLTMTLLAPTGIASKRLAETTHEKASTIHLKCLKDKEINTDVLILDEFGMCNVDTVNMLINCITNPKIRIVMVADKKQTAPIGVGAPYSDLLESHIVPTTILSKVFRYGDSGIAYVNTNTRMGKDFFNDEVVKHNDNKITIMKDWTFYEENTDEEIAQKVLDEYSKLRNKGVNKNDIMILSAYNGGECGVVTLNNIIQSAWNPPKANEKIFERKIPRCGKVVFRVGDKVINIKNNYQALTYESWLEIQDSNGTLTEEDVETTILYNGQDGVVTEVRDDIMVVKFDEELIVFDKLLAYNLLLGYVRSEHRSQGSENSEVIVVVSPTQHRLMTRNLMYVAQSRAKKHCISIGSVQAYKDALRIDAVDIRNTWLLDLLTTSTETETQKTA
jgi:RecD/TraA family predicted helicase